MLNIDILSRFIENNKLIEKEDRVIRSINEYTIDFTNLKNKLARYAANIEKIEYMSDYDFEAINKGNFDSSWKKIEA